MENNIYKLAENLVKLLKEKKLKVSFAESCTGGMASSAITSVAGSSDVLDLSIVTYANSAKIKFTDVTQEILDKHGAVSSQTALLMAQGIRATSGADIGVGITGIAGPDGGTDDKPVGTVYVAVDNWDRIQVKHFTFEGGRQQIREQTVKQALEMIQEIIT